jgi:molybdopterin molybdotransferase
MADSDVEAFTVDIGDSGHHGHEDHAHESGVMRPVDQVRDMILQRVRSLVPIELHLQEAYGCVLASDVAAELDLPGFSSSAMDGFAVRASDITAAMVDEPVALRIVGRAPVGQPPGGTVGSGEAIRIATGAPVPAGADCIAPIEHCVVEGETVHVLKVFR